MGSLLRMTNQKCARNLKRTIKTSDMALLLVELVESFAIRHPRHTYRLRLSVASLLFTSHSCHVHLTLTCVHNCCLSFYSASTKKVQCASYQGSRRILSRRQYAPNKRCALNNNVCLITRFYGMHLTFELYKNAMKQESYKHPNIYSDFIYEKFTLVLLLVLSLW